MSNLTSTDDQVLFIAEYTLGLLSLEETAKAQALLNSDPQAVVTALKWEEALLNLADRLSPATLPDHLWQEISSSLGLDPIVANLAPANLVSASSSPPTDLTASASSLDTHEQITARVHHVSESASVMSAPEDRPVPLPLRPEPPSKIAHSPETLTKEQSKKQNKQKTNKQPRLTGWRPSLGQIVLTGIVFLGVVIVAAILQPRTPVQPPITVIEVTPKQAAILQAPGQSSTPGWVVTISPSNDVLFNPQVLTDIPMDASVQLWTYSKSQPTPRSLGLIDPNQPVTVPASLMGAIEEQQFFEMTQETAGGSVTGRPSGPVLFIGRIVTFG